MSGWLSALLLLFPLSLIFYFIPGTKGSNKYGLRPPPNSKVVIASSIVFPLMMVVLIGIMATNSTPSIKKSLDKEKKARDNTEQQNKDARSDLERLERHMKEQEQ